MSAAVEVPVLIAEWHDGQPATDLRAAAHRYHTSPTRANEEELYRSALAFALAAVNGGAK